MCCTFSGDVHNSLPSTELIPLLFITLQGLLHEQGHLVGPLGVENARFGVAISAVPDLNLDGFSDVVVGAPLEDSGRGAVYVFSGDDTTVRLRHSQVQQVQVRGGGT